jgi:bis(5'-nucleosyl)-tetraphosphatase (symmetrical)
MATYAFGDIQGCYDPLRRLMDYISFDPDRDRAWFVGDLVNRGPQSAEVLRFVKGLGQSAVTVLGNHDLHLIMQSEDYGKPNKEDTFGDVLVAKDRDDLLYWLRTQPLFHAEGTYAMVHAGLLPQWSVARAQVLAGEVEAALRAPRYRDFLANMWGSEPTGWQDNLLGWDRLRVVVNAMTRMRFCSADGMMEFRSKGPPDRPPAGCMPWFDVPGRASAGNTLICGHWSALGFRQSETLLALDSGCLWGGRLTCVRLEDRRVFQLPCPQQAKPAGWD